jgi:hypothetical protein
VAENGGSLAGAEDGDVVDPLGADDQRRHQCRPLQPDVRSTGNATQVDALIEELAHPKRCISVAGRRSPALATRCSSSKLERMVSRVWDALTCQVPPATTLAVLQKPLSQLG